jgi:hypothetical protein
VVRRPTVAVAQWMSAVCNPWRHFIFGMPSPILGLTFGSESLGRSRPVRLSNDGFSGAEGVLTIVAMRVKAPQSTLGASPGTWLANLENPLDLCKN